jgi:hypothetical protein
MILFCFLIATGSSQFLRLSPGVVSQGLGGVSVVVDEGLSVFHNPACAEDMTFNFTLSRWLYSTSYVACGGVYGNNLFGVSYMNYGSIQGYDAQGNPTTVFTPYDFCAGVGRRQGRFGFVIKGFMEKIDSQSLYGLCAAIGICLQYKGLTIGIKVDNLGKEFAESTSIPTYAALGLKYGLTTAMSILVECKAPLTELNAGIVYKYKDLFLLFGTRYLRPENLVDGSNVATGFADLSLTGGLAVHVQNYRIGYSLVYGNQSNAHQFSVMFVPSVPEDK